MKFRTFLLACALGIVGLAFWVVAVMWLLSWACPNLNRGGTCG